MVQKAISLKGKIPHNRVCLFMPLKQQSVNRTLFEPSKPKPSSNEGSLCHPSLSAYSHMFEQRPVLCLSMILLSICWGYNFPPFPTPPFLFGRPSSLIHGRRRGRDRRWTEGLNIWAVQSRAVVHQIGPPPCPPPPTIKACHCPRS